MGHSCVCKVDVDALAIGCAGPATPKITGSRWRRSSAHDNLRRRWERRGARVQQTQRVCLYPDTSTDLVQSVIECGDSERSGLGRFILLDALAC
jgi:hypothetical protein